MGAGEDSGAFAAITPDTPAPGAPQVPEDHDLAALKDRARAAVELLEQAARAAGGDVMLVHVSRQAADVAAALARAAETDQVRREVWLDGYAAAEARCPVPLPQRRKPGGHRRPRPNPGQLRLLGLVPAAAWAALKHALHNGPAAKMIAVPSAKAALAVTAGTAAVAAIGTVAVVTLVPSHAGTPAFGSAGVAAPAASIEAAVPYPSSTPIAFLATHPRGGKHPGKGGPGLSGSGAPLPSPPYAPVTAPSSSPSSSAPSAPSSGPAEGTLSIPAAANGIAVSDPTQTVTIELDASASGNVPWGLTCRTDPGSPSGCADIAFSATDGSIPAGGSATVELTFDAAAQATGGSVTLVIDRIPVKVTWQSAPQPTPAATDSPSSAPSAIPSPGHS